MGSDRRVRLCLLRPSSFNPRSRMGSDCCCRDRPHGLWVSIHAPTRGATPWHSNTVTAWFCFNPRSHIGSDCVHAPKIGRANVVSIHAPTWGATGRRSLCRGHRSVSTHAPTRGATKGMGVIKHKAKVSTHAPAWGATCCNGSYRYGMGIVSTHAPAWGATR